MSENKSPVLKEDRASRVSFGDWTLDDFTLSTFCKQLLIDARGRAPKLRRCWERLFSGSATMAGVDLARAIHHGLGSPITIPQLVIPECGG